MNQIGIPLMEKLSYIAIMIAEAYAKFNVSNKDDIGWFMDLLISNYGIYNDKEF